MASRSPKQVTGLLELAGQGSRKAIDQLLSLLYDELRRLAQGYLEGERADHTLQATALVHEAYLRLVGQESIGFRTRAQFFGAAAQVMRRILIDHARTKHRAKRGGDAVRCTLDTLVSEYEDRAIDLVDLDDALSRLASFDPRKAKLVELRFFAGLNVADAAKMLDISQRTAERDWMTARAWLQSELTGAGPDGT